MQLYLSHNYAARNFLNFHVGPTLLAMGHQVEARWLSGEHSAREEEKQKQYATEDFLDVSACDILIHFCDQYGQTPGRGKHIEVGYALACGKRIIVVGEDREASVFYFMQNVIRFRYIEDMYTYLSTLPRG